MASCMGVHFPMIKALSEVVADKVLLEFELFLHATKTVVQRGRGL